MSRTLYGSYFYGNKISEYGLENNRLDYETLAKAFDAVLYNDIWALSDDWENTNTPDHSDEIDELEEQIEELEAQIDEPEVFQYFIISDAGAEIVSEWTDDPVYYSDRLDMYVWGVTHWGTSWDYVLTDVVCNTGEVE